MFKYLASVLWPITVKSFIKYCISKIQDQFVHSRDNGISTKEIQFRHAVRSCPVQSIAVLFYDQRPHVRKAVAIASYQQ